MSIDIEEIFAKTRGPDKGQLVQQTASGLSDLGKNVNNLVEIGNKKVINRESDLPDVNQSGEHALKDNTLYRIEGFVTVTNPIRLGNSTPIVGGHGSLDGIIHTGQQDAIRGTNSGLFLKDMYLHAPGGTIFNISGDISTEILCESISISDAAGLGNIASLGTIDGFRVPSFKGCNFENFADGLTFTGTTDKIFFSECPFREVSASNVRIIELDSNLDVDIIDLTDNYVKGVQNDTEVIYIDPGATISDQLQYRGTVHDGSVNTDNILTGDGDKNAEPYWVTDSYPLSNSQIYGGYDIDSSGTITINSQASDDTDEAAYEVIDLTTTSTGLARFTHQSPNQITYTGSRSRALEINVGVSAETGNTEVLAVAVFQNNGIMPGSPRKFTVQSLQFSGGTAIAGTGTATVVIEQVDPGDTFSAAIANLGSTTDIEISEMEMDIVTA